MNTAYFVLIASAVAAYTDLRSKRIPNLLVVTVLAGGLILRSAGGFETILQSLEIFIALVVLGCVLFSLRIMGGGDVKFIAAAGAALGWPYVVPFLVWTILAGGLLGLFFCLVRGKLRATMATIGFLSLTLLSGGRPASNIASAGSLPYALAIFGGACAAAMTITLHLHPMQIPL